MFIVTHRKLFYILSGLVIAVSILALAIWGLKPGIDFKGGSLLEASYPDGRPEKNPEHEVRQKLFAKCCFGQYQMSDPDGVLIDVSEG